jgi:hypothetical protein
VDWDLISWSFTVIRRNKQLAVFPALSSAAVLAGLLVFSLLRRGGPQKWVADPITLADYLWGVVALFLVSVVVIFFNCALAASVSAAFDGRPATVAYGLGHAAARLPRILAWALLSTSVGLVLSEIERRASFLGKLTTWIFGFAWAMATYLVIPVLIAEDHGAIGSVKRAAKLARKTWGDQIVADIRFGWRALGLFLPGVVLFVIALNGYPIVLPVAVVYVAVAATTISAAHGIFDVALYRFAANGETPRDWSPKMAGILR